MRTFTSSQGVSLNALKTSPSGGKTLCAARSPSTNSDSSSKYGLASSAESTFFQLAGRSTFMGEILSDGGYFFLPSRPRGRGAVGLATLRRSVLPSTLLRSVAKPGARGDKVGYTPSLGQRSLR